MDPDTDEYDEFDGSRYSETKLPVNVRASFGEIYNIEIQTTVLADLTQPEKFIAKLQHVGDLLARALPKAHIKGETNEEEVGVAKDGKLTKGPKGISESVASLEKLKSDMPTLRSEDGQ
jgi:hypothetical protein